MLNRLKPSCLVLAAAGFALGAASANAADIYNGASSKDAPAYAPVTSWTGFYIGVNGGYGWSAGNQTLATNTNYLFYSEFPDSNTFQASIGKLNPEGGFGGGQIGFNTQRGNFVFGIEVDAQGSDISGRASASLSTAGLTSPAITIGASANSELDWFATFRGRLGYAAGPALFYVTGGFAVGGVKDTLSLNSTPNYGSYVFGNSETRAGYTLGGGIEYFISPSWSLKAEYQYVDLGSSTIKGSILSTDLSTYAFYGALTTNKIDHSYDTIRAGLNYHIGQVYEPLK